MRTERATVYATITPNHPSHQFRRLSARATQGHHRIAHLRMKSKSISRQNASEG